MFANKFSNEIVLIDFGGAAGYNDGINIYSDGFIRTSLLNQIRFGNKNFIKENPRDSFVGAIKTIIYLEQKCSSYGY